MNQNKEKVVWNHELFQNEIHSQIKQNHDFIQSLRRQMLKNKQ